MSRNAASQQENQTINGENKPQPGATEDTDLLYYRGITLNHEQRVKIKLNIGSFRVKVMLMLSLILSILILVAINGFLLNKSALNGQLKQLRNQLMTIAQISALSVDADLLETDSLNSAIN